MEERIYKKVIELDKEIQNLKEVKKKINCDGKLMYAREYRDSGNNIHYELYASWQLACINDIIEKHDKQISEEINKKIEDLKKEIESL